MTANLELNEVNNKIKYAFRFSTSNQRVYLNQKQLDRIPYLATLIAHKDDFLSIQNENDEYILNPPIHYTWFMPILRSITSEQPYVLFTELSERENVLDTLQLFDYLGINSFARPFLNVDHLALSNSINDDTNEKHYIRYRHANLSEARNTAAQFILSISKNEYNLYDADTLDFIFYLIMIIFSNNNVFSSRFRYHTLTIITKYCRSLFSKRQRRQLPTFQQIVEDSSMDVWFYLYDEYQPLPKNFDNVFTWKGDYNWTENIYSNFSWWVTKSISRRIHANLKQNSIRCPFISTLWLNLLKNGFNSHDMKYKATIRALPTIEICNDKNFYMKESQSARSGRFNTLPKRPNVDKFKHRFGPKAQKYR